MAAAREMVTLSLNQLAFALAGSASGAAVQALFVNAPSKLEIYSVDTARNESCVLRNQGTTTDTFGTYFLASGQWALLLPTLVGYPALILMTVRPSWTMIAATFSSLVLGCGMLLALWQGVGLVSALPALGAPSLMATVAIWLTQPKGSKLWFKMLLLCALGSIILLFVLVMSTVPSRTLRDKIVLSCLAFPLGKELAAIPARLVARSFVTKERDGSAWVFPLAVYTAFAILARLATASLQGVWLVASVLFQGATEVALRLTMVERDRLILHVARMCCWSRAGRALASITPAQDEPTEQGEQPASEQREDGRAATEAKRAQARASAQLCNAEVLAEYLGIILSTWLILLARPRPLTVPAQIFLEQERPFDEPLPLHVVGGSAGIMLATELLVDAACAEYKRRRGSRLDTAWYALPVWRRLSVALAAAAAATGCAMLGFSFTSNSSVGCDGRNLCFCTSGNGIRPGTLEDVYCERLYGDTAGYPPGVHAITAVEAALRGRWPRRAVDLELLSAVAFPVPVTMASDQEVPAELEVARGRGPADLRERILAAQHTTASSVLFYLDANAPALPHVAGHLCEDVLPVVRMQPSQAALAAALHELFNATRCAGNEACVAQQTGAFVTSHPDCMVLPHLPPS